MNIYHLDCSLNESEQSLTRKYSKLIVDRLKTKNQDASVNYIDLTKENIPFINKDYEKAMFKKESERTLQEKVLLEAFDIKPFLDADVYVFGVPGYLFNVPAVFKNWLEHLFRIDATIDENWVGLLNNKTIYVVSAWGGVYSNTVIGHTFEKIIKKSFNLFGITNINFFNVYRDEETETDNIKNIRQAIMESI